MNGVKANAVKKALADSALIIEKGWGGSLVSFAEDETLDIHLLGVVEDTVKRIGKRSTEIFKTKKASISGNFDFSSLDGLGRTLLVLLNANGLRRIREEYPEHEFNPYLRAFFRMVDVFRADYDVRDLAILPSDQREAVFEKLNAACYALKAEMNSKGFVAQLQKRQRAVNKNYRGLSKYIDGHFGGRARLLALRIDLGFAKDWRSVVAGGGPVDWASLKVYLKKLIRTLSEHVLKDVWRGFSYKIEFGLKKGLHIHLLVLLDGSKAWQDVTIARMIGELWETNITGGKGTYFNCNAIKTTYRGCGIGMVHADDIEMRENLYRAALYLTKTDYYIALVAPELGRTFGRGKMPKPVTKRLGRPRKTVI